MYQLLSFPPFLSELIESLRFYLPVITADLAADGDVVQLQLGERPVLYLDTTCPPQQQAWGLMQAMRTLEFGADAVPAARPRRRLRSVG